MAERLFVTRQAVSRWECGDTGPDAPFTEDEARAYMEALLPTLDRWKGAASD